jgi:hypothetical protein
VESDLHAKILERNRRRGKSPSGRFQMGIALI